VLQEADITNQFKNGITELEPAEINKLFKKQLKQRHEEDEDNRISRATPPDMDSELSLLDILTRLSE